MMIKMYLYNIMHPQSEIQEGLTHKFYPSMIIHISSISLKRIKLVHFSYSMYNESKLNNCDFFKLGKQEVLINKNREINQIDMITDNINESGHLAS